MDDQQARQIDQVGDQGEILHRIERQVGVDGRIDRVRADRIDVQRVAVGLRFRHVLGSNVAGGARPVLGDHLLAPLLREFLAERTGENVRSAARRERYDDADRPRRIILRMDRRMGAQQSEHGRCGGYEGRIGHSCGSPLRRDVCFDEFSRRGARAGARAGSWWRFPRSTWWWS